jgi:hypothetical protein
MNRNSVSCCLVFVISLLLLNEMGYIFSSITVLYKENEPFRFDIETN